MAIISSAYAHRCLVMKSELRYLPGWWSFFHDLYGCCCRIVHCNSLDRCRYCHHANRLSAETWGAHVFIANNLKLLLLKARKKANFNCSKSDVKQWNGYMSTIVSKTIHHYNVIALLLVLWNSSFNSVVYKHR